MMAIVLVVLMGSAAMAVDLGWLYWQSIEIQHGADAAALAGVIYEPDQRTNAHTAGIEAAVQNGFVHDPADGNAIEIIDFVDDPTAVQHDSQLRATLTKRVPTFFLGIMGIQTVDISRTALAEFVQPLALGSPEIVLRHGSGNRLRPGYVGEYQRHLRPKVLGRPLRRTLSRYKRLRPILHP
jgi:uncharacterized membrane protein